MKKSKLKKRVLMVFFSGVIIVLGAGLYLYNKPHRDVQSINADFQVEASRLVNEYLENSITANEKYLDDEGESKIFEVSGVVNQISEDFNHQKVILLKSENDSAGVSCTFTKETNGEDESFQVGDKVTIKGVIRSGATFDEDLEMYENVIIEKSSVVK